MAEDSQKTNKSGGIFDASPKSTFVMGLLVGVVVCVIVGLVLSLTILREGSTKESNSNTTANTNSTTNPGFKSIIDQVLAGKTPSGVDSTTPYKFDIKETDNIKGSSSAKVTLVLFSDFQCPFCQRHEAILKQITDAYGAKVRLVFYEFPLTSIHQYAQKAAEAAECAADQGKFWEMHDKLFAEGASSNTNTAEASLSVANLKKYAADLKLDTTKFNKCLDNSEKATKVTEDITLGTAAGVQGTPATFVNGYLVSGAIPFEDYTSTN